MSYITDQLQAAAVESNALLGDRFTLVGTCEVLVGVFNARRKQYQDQDGGISEIIEHTVVFPTASTTTRIKERDAILKDGVTYFVTDVTDDNLHTRASMMRRTV